MVQKMGLFIRLEVIKFIINAMPFQRDRFAKRLMDECIFCNDFYGKKSHRESQPFACVKEEFNQKRENQKV